MFKIKFSTQHVLSLLLLFLFNQSSYAQFGGPSPVKVAKVQKTMMSPVRAIPATFQAKVTTTIKAESKGIVKSLAEIGQVVKQGQALAELTDTQSALREQELLDAVNSSKARYNFLKAEKSRLSDLVSKNLISKTELEQNNSDFLAAKSDLAQSQSRYQQYQDQVTKLSILAPFDGYVISQNAQIGQFLNTGNDVLRFQQANNLEVIVNVPMSYKQQIQKNAIWQIKTEDGIYHNAKIKTFIPASLNPSHTIEVRLTIDNNNKNTQNFWSGQAVNVLVPTQKAQEVTAVPRDALVIRSNEIYIYKVIDNKAIKTPVQTGIAQGMLIEVKGNLKINDIIITRGNERLRPQAEVKIIE